MSWPDRCPVDEKVIRGCSILIALAVPVVLIGNALWALAGPWLIDLAYAFPGFPDDRFGLDRDQRTELADTGVSAVTPFGGGVEALRRTELPDGDRAFGLSEIRHMEDVRALITGYLVAWGAGLCVLLLAGAVLVLRGGSAALLRALRLGALATLVGLGVVGLFAVVAFDAFFTAFHGIFFEGDTWRFADETTLRRVYPDAFWAFAGAAMGLVVAGQAGLLVLAGRFRH
jgi:integral membrane protein (TIGR01906 family)